MKNLIAFLTIIAAFSLVAQSDNGFYGHKIFVQPEFLINNPLVYNLATDEYENSALTASGSSLVSKKDQLNIGYRVTAGYAIKRNMAVGIEVGQDFSSFYPTRYSYVTDEWGNTYYSSELDHEMVDLSTFSIVPKMEFANSKALLPMGLSHSVGFGVAFTKMVEKNYLFRNTDYYSGNTGMQNYANSTLDPIEISKYPPLRKFVILYAINMRTPVTKNILITYGLKYTLNVGGKKGYTYPGVNQTFSEYSVIEEMSRQRSFSFINANFGVAYTF